MRLTELSKPQQKALRKLCESGEWMCSYELRVSLSTLQALRKRGLVKVRGYKEPSAIFSPATTLEWKATVRITKK